MTAGSSADTSGAAEPAEQRTRRPLVTVVALCFGGLAVSLTQTLVVPIQSRLPLLLDTSRANAGWVVTVTLLAGAVSMVVSGRVGDLLGKQRVLAATGGSLVAGSLVCALSGTLGPLLVGRALQGVALGFIPVGIALMREVTPPRLTSTAIAAMSATLGVGGAIGLPLSAAVADGLGWHALFWMSAVVAAAMTAAVVLLVPHVDDASGGRVDFPGALGLVLGLVAVLVAVSKSNAWGWLDGRTLGLLGGGLVVLLVWGWYELRRDEPLVDLRATAQPAVLLTNLAAVAVGFGMMAQAVVMPQLLQLPESTGYGLGESVFASGLWLAPGGLMMLALAPVSSRLIDGFGPKVALALGAGILGCGYGFAFLLMGAAWQILVATCIIGAGVAVAYAAMPTLVMDAVPSRDAGAAVGINALGRSIGTTTAAAVMTTLLTSSTRDLGGIPVPSEGSYELCFLVGSLAAFAGVAITLLVPHTHRRRVAPLAAEELAETG